MTTRVTKGARLERLAAALVSRLSQLRRPTFTCTPLTKSEEKKRDWTARSLPKQQFENIMVIIAVAH